jgi:N-acetylneuraminic acid mutarotase
MKPAGLAHSRTANPATVTVSPTPCAPNAQFLIPKRCDRHCAQHKAVRKRSRARFGEIKHVHMKKRSLVLKTLLAFAAATLLSGLRDAAAQGTAFTYQGRLNDNGSPANGNYDLQFAIYADISGPNLIAGPLTNSPTVVSNGIFVVALDFGPGVFTGADRWLEIGVRANAGSGFTIVSPRQKLTATPYSITAINVTGPINGGLIINGTITSAQLANGAVNASNIANGSITAAQLAAGAAASNLFSSGQSGVAGGGIVLSENPNNTALLNAGYVRIGKVDLVPERWTTNAAGPPPNGTGADRIDHTAVWTGSEMIIWGGYNGTYRNDGLRYNPATDSWTATSKTGAPSARRRHSAVWTGTQMIVWGGPDNKGGRYNPATDTWTATSRSNAPSARDSHVAVWTGSLMLIWGGFGGGVSSALGNGARYNPSTDTWTDMAASPISARAISSFVWTGSRLIIWGGQDNRSDLTAGFWHDGAKYNPSTDSWVAISTVNTPGYKAGASAVWTGIEMLVWGGNGFEYYGGPGPFVSSMGARYNSAADTWSAMNTSGAPFERESHTAVWGGSRMIIWGGSHPGLGGDVQPLGPGGRYDPATDSWAGTASSGAPVARYGHTAVWTGSRMIIFGGVGDQGFLDDGSRYDVTNNTWAATSAALVGSEPSERQGATAVWTGTEMIVWGGEYQGTSLRSGGRYDPILNSWTQTRLSTAPSARVNHTAVWTGTEMIIWGGEDEAETATGARYNPVVNQWRATSTTNAPFARQNHTAVWTGTEMIVWGGVSNIFLNGYGDLPNEFSSGGRYNPLTDAWSAVSSGANRPAPRQAHACVWTGNEMIIWGGQRHVFAIPSPTKTHYGDGARYLPASDTWIALPQTNAPAPRSNMGAVWTGTDFIVWAGADFNGSGGGGNQNTGARYNLASNTWTGISTDGAPSARNSLDAFWDGTHVIAWGGAAGGPLYDGGRYDPATDLWRPTAYGGSWLARSGHASAWTGVQMLVVGGVDSASIYQDDNYAYSPPRTTYLYMKP